MKSNRRQRLENNQQQHQKQKQQQKSKDPSSLPPTNSATSKLTNILFDSNNNNNDDGVDDFSSSLNLSMNFTNDDFGGSTTTNSSNTNNNNNTNDNTSSRQNMNLTSALSNAASAMSSGLGGSFSVTRSQSKQKMKKNSNNETTTSMKEEDAAATSNENKKKKPPQPKQQKYQTFVREAPAIIEERRQQKQIRTPFDEKQKQETTTTSSLSSTSVVSTTTKSEKQKPPQPQQEQKQQLQAQQEQKSQSKDENKQNSSLVVTKNNNNKTQKQKVQVLEEDEEVKETTTKEKEKEKDNFVVPKGFLKNNNYQQQQQQQQQEQVYEHQEEYLGENDISSATEAPQADEIFSSLHPRLVSAVKEKLCFSDFTYVQRVAWLPISSSAGDVLIRSETGSGKTLAYAMPLLHLILSDTDKNKIDRTVGTLMIVMTPTRELAEQCCAVITKLASRSVFVVVGAIHGGDDRHHEKSRLRKGIHVLVSTPGRLLDHLKLTNSFVRDNLRYIVLDEADRLLDMGFERSIGEIMSLLPEPRKRVLVSATITSGVERLTHFVMKPPLIKVGNTEDVFEVPDTLTQKFVNVPAKHRLVCLASLLWSKLLTIAVSSSSSSATTASTNTHIPHHHNFSASNLKNVNKKIVVFVSTSDAVEFLFLLFSRLISPYLNHQNSKKTFDSAASTSNNNNAADLSLHTRTRSNKKKTAVANQHLYDGNNVVEFDDDDDYDDDEDSALALGGGDSRVALATRAYKQQQQQNSGNSTSGGGNTYDTSSSSAMSLQLSDETAFLRGADIFKLHGNMSQVDRQAVYTAFKKSSCAVLFCTDVASRGLDIPNVDLIVHYDPPQDERCYVHRVGRTARIGSSGESILFVMPHEAAYVDFLASSTNHDYNNNNNNANNNINEIERKKSFENYDADGGYHHEQQDSASASSTSKQQQQQQQHHQPMLMEEVSLDVILFHLSKMDRKSGPGRHWVHSAAFLQKAMCDLAKNDSHVRQVSMFAYQSYVRAYAAMPREVKSFFDQRQLHLGHIATSFASESTPAQLQREMKFSAVARREKQQARDAVKVRKQGVKVDNTNEQYHSTLLRKALFETKDRVDSGTAGIRPGATAIKGMTEFEA